MFFGSYFSIAGGHGVRVSEREEVHYNLIAFLYTVFLSSFDLMKLNCFFILRLQLFSMHFSIGKKDSKNKLNKTVLAFR